MVNSSLLLRLLPAWLGRSLTLLADQIERLIDKFSMLQVSGISEALTGS
jgi:hypothetical protein